MNVPETTASWHEPGLLAVLAHGILNSVSVIRGAAEALRDDDPALDPATKAYLLELVMDQAATVASVAEDIIRDLPKDITDVLSVADEMVRASLRLPPGRPT